MRNVLTTILRHLLFVVVIFWAIVGALNVVELNETRRLQALLQTEIERAQEANGVLRTLIEDLGGDFDE